MRVKSSSGSFVPTTTLFNIPDVNNEPDVKKLLVKLYQSLNVMALSLNTKVTGYLSTEELVNGKLLYPSDGSNSSVSGHVAYRPVFQTVVNCGALPSSAVKTIPHHLNITGSTFVSIGGSATNPGTAAIPIPYDSLGFGSRVTVWVDATNVNIQANGAMGAYTESEIILEYVKT